VWNALANALILLCVVAVMTTVLIILYKKKCYKVSTDNRGVMLKWRNDVRGIGAQRDWQLGRGLQPVTVAEIVIS